MTGFGWEFEEFRRHCGSTSQSAPFNDLVLRLTKPQLSSRIIDASSGVYRRGLWLDNAGISLRVAHCLVMLSAGLRVPLSLSSSPGKRCLDGTLNRRDSAGRSDPVPNCSDRTFYETAGTAPGMVRVSENGSYYGTSRNTYG